MSNGMGDAKTPKIEELRATVGQLRAGEELTKVLEAEARSNPAVAERVAGLVVALISEAGRKSPADPKGQTGPQVSLDGAATVLKSVSFVFPRGRHDVGFLADGLGICGTKHDLKIPYTAIEHVAVLDNIPNEGKRVLVMMAFSRTADFTYGKQKVSSVLLQFSTEGQLDIPNPRDPSARLQGPSVVVLCQALGCMDVHSAAFCSPNLDDFQSSKKGPSISAFVKVNRGWLFPLPQALCFVERPPMLIPHSEIKYVELGRAGGMSATFDLIIHLNGGEHVEFGQVGTEELTHVSGYIAAKKIKLGDGDGKSASSEDVDDDSDDLEDEDFDPEAMSDSSDELRPHKRKRVEGPSTSAAGGSSAAAWEPDEDDVPSDEDSEDVELVSDDEISATKIRALVEEDRIASKTRLSTTGLQPCMTGVMNPFPSGPGGGSGSGSGPGKPGGSSTWNAGPSAPGPGGSGGAGPSGS